MKYYLGIDGGGTKTTAAVSDENGNILLKQIGKSINFYSVGMDSARFNLETIIIEIDAALGINEYESAFIGCSALDSEADEELTAKLCGGILNAKKIKMHSDVYIALRALGDVLCPCAAVCGTGSMAVAEDENGSIHMKGGWGHIVGDEGSAYSIAVSAIKECCMHYDAGKVTPVLQSAMKFFDVDDFRKAIDKIYSPETTKDVLAMFAEDVSRLALSGEKISVDIITNEAIRFTETVLLLLDEIKYCSVLGLYGGVLVHNSIFKETFIKTVRTYYPDLRIQTLATPPEESAAQLARKL